MPPLNTGGVVSIIVGGVLILLGLALVQFTRSRPDRRLPSLAGVGEISIVTACLAGLALVAIGYHILAHTFGWGFAAPLGWALLIAFLVIVGSIGVDALENRGRSDNPRDDNEPHR